MRGALGYSVCGFGYFLDRFFGFGVHCGFFDFNFWFLVLVFWLWYPMWFLVCPILFHLDSGFASIRAEIGF